MLWSGVPLIALGGAIREGRARIGARSSCIVGAGGSRHCTANLFQRNAVSLLVAAAQPHLQAFSWPGYELLAVTAARRRATWLRLRDNVQAARLWAPLFNTTLWSQGFASGVRIVWEGFAAGRALHTLS